MRRARGNGGRFAKKYGADTSNTAAKEKDAGSGPAHSSMSPSSSGSEPWNSSNVQQEGRGLQVRDVRAAQNYLNGSSCYQNQGGLQDPAYHMHSGERADEGDCSGPTTGKHIF